MSEPEFHELQSSAVFGRPSNAQVALLAAVIRESVRVMAQRKPQPQEDLETDCAIFLRWLDDCDAMEDVDE